MADVPDRLLPASQPAASGAARADLPKPLSRSLLILLTCGVAGTVLFPIIYVIEGATRPGYDAWRQTISALTRRNHECFDHLVASNQVCSVKEKKGKPSLARNNSRAQPRVPRVWNLGGA